MALGVNLELKARDRDPARSVTVCEEIGATDEGVLSQLDTYFAAPRGRLKLRELAGAGAQLIAYERADDRDSKESRYHLVAVEGLGSFIEFEGVATADTEADGFVPLLVDLRRRFGIEDDGLLAVSYSDLVEAAAVG